MPLKNIRIVLINTTHPGNIGGVARAMKNMGLERLYLVSPKDFPSKTATARASSAPGILASATVCDSVAQAIADCTLVIGTSARRRTIEWPQFSPRECANKIVAHAVDANVALLFGRERSGLTNAEVDRCRYLVSIPSDQTYSSLNLVCAVQVLAYELRVAADQRLPNAGTAETPPTASVDQLHRFYQHLEEVLLEVDFVNDKHVRRLMRKLIRFFNRGNPSQEEVNILRGILTAVQRSRRQNT